MGYDSINLILKINLTFYKSTLFEADKLLVHYERTRVAGSNPNFARHFSVHCLSCIDGFN